MTKKNILILLLSFSIIQMFGQDNYAPTQLKAFQNKNTSAVNLQWNAPQQNQFLSYADTTALSGFGFKEAKIVKIASKWDKEQLRLVNNMQISAVDFRLNSKKCILTLKIWKGSNAQEEIVSQSVSDLSTSEWNHVELTQTITIDTNSIYWIGYEIDTKPGNVIGTDHGPFVEGVNMINMLGTWSPIEEKFPTVERNFQIRFYVKAGENSIPANGFNLYRNNEKINPSLISTSNYIDSLTEEGDYSYSVEAVYDETVSEKSNPVNISFTPNIIKKNYVIVEKGTGTWCSWCPLAARALDEMHANGKDILVVAYHSGDNYELLDGKGRITYYGMGGFPAVYMEGSSVPNAGTVENWYSNLMTQYNQAIEQPAPYVIKPKLGSTDTSFYCQVATQNPNENQTDNLILHAVITESHIDQAWQDMTELNDVARKMIPNVNGTQVSFNNNNESIVNLNFKANENWNLENSKLVLFLQNKSTKEVLQANSYSLKKVQLTPYNVQVEIDSSALAHKVVWNYATTENVNYELYLNQELMGTTPDTYFMIDTSKINHGETYKIGIKAINNDFESAIIENYFVAYKKLSIGNIQNFDQPFSIFPNPANDHLFIDGKQKISTASIFDLKGHLLIQKNQNCSVIDVSSLSKGIYILQISTGKKLINTKVSIH